MIIGTHGRSIFIADISNVQQLVDSNLQKEILVFETKDIKYNNEWGKKQNVYSPIDSLLIPLSVYSKSTGEAELQLFYQNTLLHKNKVKLNIGINSLGIEGNIDAASAASFLKEYKKEYKEYHFPETDDKKNYLPTATYKIKVSKAGITEETNFKIK